MATCPTCLARYPDDVSTCTHDGTALVGDDLLEPIEPQLAVGALVGEYRIEGKLGEGGFGTVYRAVHPLIGKAAAIKVLSRQFSSNPQIVSRFVAEARAVNQIRHRNIIDIFSFGVLDDGRQYYVMELLEGMTLDAYLRQRGRIPPADAIPILARVARALDAAHAAGIAHRDLKPENIFLVHDEDTGLFPKLLDFGIAKLLGDSSSGSHHKTRTGMAMGTPLYMSPEQCRGKNVDHRTDIYSFGIMVHELLTGSPPFDAEDAVDLLIKQTTADPPAVSSVCPDLPATLDAPIRHMLEKDPEQRPRTVGEGVEALASAAKKAGIEVNAVVSRPNLAQPAASGVRVVTDPAAGMGKTEVVAVTQVAPLETTKPSAGSTDPGRAAPAPHEAASSRRALIAVAGALVVAGLIAFFAFRSAPGDASASSSPPSTSSSAVVAEPLPATSAATAPPVVEPTPSASVVPAAVEPDVEIAIQTRTPGVDVWLDGERIGAAPGSIRIPRGKTSKLVFKAKGHADLTREVAWDAAGPIEIELRKIGGAPKPQISKDLANPF